MPLDGLRSVQKRLGVNEGKLLMENRKYLFLSLSLV